jgi:hypothetical protein
MPVNKTTKLKFAPEVGGSELSVVLGLASLQQLIIFGMSTYPKPQQPIFYLDGYCSISLSHPHRPKPFHFLEMQRGMFWIFFEKLIIPIG